MTDKNEKMYVEYIGGACPTQAWGDTADGERFYFRARNGQWTLRIGPTNHVVRGGGDVPVDGRVVATGPINPRDPDPLDGVMDSDQVRRILAAFCDVDAAWEDGAYL